MTVRHRRQEASGAMDFRGFYKNRRRKKEYGDETDEGGSPHTFEEI